MKTLFFYLLAVFISTSSFAEKTLDSELLTEKIKRVLSDFGENIDIGILVKDVKTGKVLFKMNEDRYFMPASNQKLLTAFAALESLGPDFRYQTQLFADYKKIKKNTLKDNLYLQFSGDPTLTLEQFDSLFHSLSEAGVKHLKGKIVIDDSAFDQMVMSPGTSWDDQDFCWGAPISSLIINHNCVFATLKPNAQIGQQAELELPPYPQSMHFVNQVLTQADSEKDCRITVKRSDEKTYTLGGCIKASAKPKLIEMAIDNPRRNMQTQIAYLLKKNQITRSGGFEYKPLTASSKAFARQDSPPLKTLVATMLKESDNMIADVLFKTMGANLSHETGSFRNGKQAVLAILANSLQLKIPKTTLFDGAGASRYNFLTPAQIATLLEKVAHSPLSADFMTSLAIAGIDGTLKDRLKTPATLGKIYAKTGSETAVTALSGYLETKNKQRLIFSIMINGYTNPSSKYKALEDKICQVLVEA